MALFEPLYRASYHTSHSKELNRFLTIYAHQCIRTGKDRSLRSIIIPALSMRATISSRLLVAKRVHRDCGHALICTPSTQHLYGVLLQRFRWTHRLSYYLCVFLYKSSITIVRRILLLLAQVEPLKERLVPPSITGLGVSFELADPSYRFHSLQSLRGNFASNLCCRRDLM